MKQYLIPIIDSVICSILFIITIYLGSGISSIISIFIFCAIFGSVFFYRASRYEALKQFLFFIILSTLLIILLFILSSRYPIFYYTFISANPDYGKPNAGSGFGVVISLFLNSVEYAVIAIIGFVRLIIKER